jgi:hypothetical protein
MIAEGTIILEVKKDELIYCQYKSGNKKIYRRNPKGSAVIQYVGSEETAPINGMVLAPVENNVDKTVKSYRGWSCFAYNGSQERAEQPIQITDLLSSEVTQESKPKACAMVVDPHRSDVRSVEGRFAS